MVVGEEVDYKLVKLRRERERKEEADRRGW